ncbi:M50 family metallopeptidase [Clostridium gasigenes]|uniref:M50 family metallopeptidase n=1 Tax=Clostridium gasigenes TaxID=94869 RepID=UPI001C0AA21E|nr:M50 family metallopeptidase [Clostridium gasigenes]MBU3089183.1 M50 family metallopeptidase [Clostridium gasigenes]
MKEICISSNLEINKIDNSKYSVFSKITKKTYMIGANEYQVLVNLNGVNTVNDLCVISDKYSKVEIERLFGKFSKIGFLKGNEGKTKQSIIKLRKGLVNPNKFIKADTLLVKIFHFIIIYLSLLLLGIGIALNISQGDAIMERVLGSLQTPAMMIMIPVFLVVLFCHEMGHMLLARYYNVNVPEMGVILYWFMPGAYVNLSGIAFLKNKRSKIIIYFGGILVNLNFMGIGLILFRLSNDSFKSFFLWLAIENLLNVVMNLFIFLKLDGYLIFQEIFDEKNLREKSFKYILGKIKALFFRNKIVLPYKVKRIDNGDENYEFQDMLYVTYGIASIIFIPILLATIIFSIL